MAPSSLARARLSKPLVALVAIAFGSACSSDVEGDLGRSQTGGAGSGNAGASGTGAGGTMAGAAGSTQTGGAGGTVAGSGPVGGAGALGGAGGSSGAAPSGGAGAAGMPDGSGGSAPSTGCGTAWVQADAMLEEPRRGGVPMLVARREIAIAGVQRLYLLVVPPAYDPNSPYPLVVGLHGSGGDREQLRGYMNVETPAAGQAIFIYPEGLPTDGGSSGWDLSNGSDDLAFIDALLVQYRAELCIDEKRIFATGHSFGGCMSNTLACYRGEVFRAVAPVAGCGGGGRNQTCTGRVATLQIHSPKDTSTSYSGAIGSCTRYLRANTCDEMPACGCHFVDGVEDAADQCIQEAQQPYATGVSLAATDRDEQPPVARAYVNCDEGFPVVFVDHWRREREMVGDPGERWHNPPPWTGALIWEFFSNLPATDVK